MSTRTDDEADILRLDNTWDEAHAHRAGTHSPTAHRGMYEAGRLAKSGGLKSSFSPLKIRVDFKSSHSSRKPATSVRSDPSLMPRIEKHGWH
jgi:hypothetical protein